MEKYDATPLNLLEIFAYLHLCLWCLFFLSITLQRKKSRQAAEDFKKQSRMDGKKWYQVTNDLTSAEFKPL